MPRLTHYPAPSTPTQRENDTLSQQAAVEKLIKTA